MDIGYKINNNNKLNSEISSSADSLIWPAFLIATWKIENVWNREKPTVITTLIISLQLLQ